MLPSNTNPSNSLLALNPLCSLLMLTHTLCSLRTLPYTLCSLLMLTHTLCSFLMLTHTLCSLRMWSHTLFWHHVCYWHSCMCLHPDVTVTADWVLRITYLSPLTNPALVSFSDRQIWFQYYLLTHRHSISVIFPTNTALMLSSGKQKLRL